MAGKLSPKPQEEVARLAGDAGIGSEDYEQWFRKQVQEGIDQLDRGEFLTYEEVGRRIDEMFRK